MKNLNAWYKIATKNSQLKMFFNFMNYIPQKTRVKVKLNQVQIVYATNARNLARCLSKINQKWSISSVSNKIVGKLIA